MKFITRKYVGDMPDRTRGGFVLVFRSVRVGGGRPRLSQKSVFDVAIGLCRGVNPQRPGHRLPLLFGLTLMYIFLINVIDYS